MNRQEWREKEMKEKAQKRLWWKEKKSPRSGCGGRSFMPFEVTILGLHFHIRRTQYYLHCVERWSHGHHCSEVISRKGSSNSTVGGMVDDNQSRWIVVVMRQRWIAGVWLRGIFVPSFHDFLEHFVETPRNLNRRYDSE